MRAFLLACLAVVILGAGGYFSLNSAQTPTGVAYTTDGARINEKWSWRSDGCDARTTWQWIFVDFGSPAGESKVCSDSQ